MKKNALPPKSIDGLRQGFTDLTENHMLSIGNTRRVGRDLLVEHENLAPRHNGAQVIVGSAVTEAEFEDDTIVTVYYPRSIIETGALGLQPSDNTLQS